MSTKLTQCAEEIHKHYFSATQCPTIESILTSHGAFEESKPKKPCYCLGRNTIERVANESQLETNEVDFVAADDLFHKNPYAQQPTPPDIAKIAEKLDTTLAAIYYTNRGHTDGATICELSIAAIKKSFTEATAQLVKENEVWKQSAEAHRHQHDCLLTERDNLLRVGEMLAEALQFVKDFQTQNCDGQIGWRSCPQAIAGDVKVENVLKAEHAIAEWEKVKK